MAQEREIAARISSLRELAEIVAAIRAIAASQMQQSLTSIKSIQSYSELIREALFDAARALPGDRTVASTRGRCGLLLFGTEHGLCGGFNQPLLRAVQHDLRARAVKPVLIVVGSRAARLCRENGLSFALAIPMATHYAGVTGTARRVAAELYQLFGGGQLAGIEVTFVRDSEGGALKIERQKLLPLELPTGKAGSPQLPPIINLRPRQLLDGIIAEYLFGALENAAMQSFFSENLARFRTMEAAHQNIRRKSAQLTTMARRMRQEAITSEILDLITGAEALSSGRDV